METQEKFDRLRDLIDVAGADRKINPLKFRALLDKAREMNLNAEEAEKEIREIAEGKGWEVEYWTAEDADKLERLDGLIELAETNRIITEEKFKMLLQNAEKMAIDPTLAAMETKRRVKQKGWKIEGIEYDSVETAASFRDLIDVAGADRKINRGTYRMLLQKAEGLNLIRAEAEEAILNQAKENDWEIETAPLHDERWEILDERRTKDLETGLIWQRENDGREYTWEEAWDYAEKLGLGGSSDWRLPTRHELKGLVTGKRYDGLYLFPEAFLHAGRHANYWSSTVYAGIGDGVNAWSVYFNKGNDNWSDKSSYNYVRCVADKR